MVVAAGSIASQIEGRKLSPGEMSYLESGFSLKSIFMFDNRTLTTNGSKWKAAFMHVVQTTPMLQAQVIGEGKQSMFSRLDQEKWPVLSVHHVEGDDRVHPSASQLNQDALEAFAAGGERLVRTAPARIHVVLGTTRVALAITTPHFFMDGIGMGAIMVMTAVYARLPKCLWFLIDRITPKRRGVPTLYDMVMKKDVGILDDFDIKGHYNAYRDPNTFGMAWKPLHGFQGKIADVPVSHIKDCRAKLREAKLSVTSAFAALSIKTLAAILDHHKMNPESKPLLSTVPVDGRSLGKWGDTKRDKNKVLPVIASYAFPCYTQIKMEDALESSLEDVAYIIKKQLHRLKSDVNFRALSILPCEVDNTMVIAPVVGVSSGVIPSILGFRNVELDSAIDFGPVPHVWFYVMTLNKVATNIIVDVNLPIEGLGEVEIKSAISKAVKGSPLEILFASL
jgi:hypothetical protein